MPARFLGAMLCVLGLVVLAACGGVTDPSDNRSTPFSGTLQVGGPANTHEFSSSKNGEFEIRLTALSPNRNVFIGIGFGQMFGGACQQIFGYVNNFAQVDRSALAGPINKAAYCAYVFDSGALTETSTYTITVSHP